MAVALLATGPLAAAVFLVATALVGVVLFAVVALTAPTFVADVFLPVDPRVLAFVRGAVAVRTAFLATDVAVLTALFAGDVVTFADAFFCVAFFAAATRASGSWRSRLSSVLIEKGTACRSPTFDLGNNAAESASIRATWLRQKVCSGPGNVPAATSAA